MTEWASGSDGAIDTPRPELGDGPSHPCRRTRSVAKLRSRRGAKRGAVAPYADELVVVDDAHYGRAEDAHMAICHMLCYAFMEMPELAKQAE